MKKVKIKYINDYLQAVMPNGQIIPEQTDLILRNEVGDKKTATATLTLIVDISDIGETDSTQDAEYSYIEKLKEEKYKALKSAIYWETLYKKEAAKTWYQKLFSL